MTTSQVALARHRTPVPLQRTSKQAVPAFLQKLHEIVNDPNNGDLIRWSEAGDSFFVLDHERFAREVLGRWFKHQNFASFVRQLNMYGFHKIPHLQQGVLRSDTDTEFWNFAHTNFRRGQPDLLCLIQRKKQTVQPGDEPVIEFRETAPVQVQPIPPPSGQIVDVNAIVNGIAAIKRHQSAISTELNELKQTNQLLWQEAMDARTKHQKQQDTINRIVKFLAGVFGHHATQHKDVGVESMQTRAVVPPRKSRFLIEDGRSGKVTVEDVQDTPDDDAPTPHYPIIETPQSIPSPASDGVSPSPLVSNYNPAPTDAPSQPQPPNPLSPSPSAATINQAYSQQVPLPDRTPVNVNERAVTPTRSPMNMEFDPRIQVVLNQLTPGQIQQLLSNLSHTLDPTQVSDITSSQLTQYMPPTDLYNQFINPLSSPTLKNAAPPEGLLSFDDNSDALNLQDSHLNQIPKSWKVAEDVERDVNSVNTDIDTFIRNLGLDPQHLTASSPNSAPGTPPPLPVRPEGTPMDPEASSSSSSAPAPAEFIDFDMLLNSLSGGNSGGADTSFSTEGGEPPFFEFDHGTPTTLDTSPSLHQGMVTPDTQARTKRKSDGTSESVTGAEEATTQSSTEHTIKFVPTKPPKRRRNK